MSMGSFSASLSGLNANQQKLSVIGNNLANINTVGFKASTVNFADLVSRSVGGLGQDPMQIGLGVTVAEVSPSFTQGGIESTGVSTHAAIEGSGFFVIGDSAERSYTRAGNFRFDATGMLVTTDGRPVQGWTTLNPLTGTMDTSTQPGRIVIPPGQLRQPTPTTSFTTQSNLDASAAVGATFSATLPILDTLGAEHIATITYTKTGATGWDYEIFVPGEDVTGGTAGTPFSIATGDVTFDGLGALAQVNGAAAADVTITSPAWINGATATNFTWDLVDADGDGNLSGFATQSATSSISQNGLPSGAVASIISVNNRGEMVAAFGAGRSIVVAQVALATFNNPQGLIKLGTNMFSETENSGVPNVGAAASGGRGSLIGAALEQSNVDIAQEFTQMILAQRGYQANSKSITVADELLIETLNLKR